MTFSKTVELIESRGLEFKGFFCLSCFWDGKPTTIFNYRRNHLIKVHHNFAECLAKEMQLEEKNPIDADKFLILLGGKQLICPHCPETMQKYTTVESSDFIVYSCDNKKCKWKQKHHSGFHTVELMQGVEKKQYYCARHRYNSSKGECFACASSRDFNKNIAPKLNKIFSKIMKE